MQEFGKAIFLLGIILVFLGGILWVSGKLPFVGKLPGDILIKRDNFTFYAPVATTIILSIILTIILNLIFRSKQ